MVNEIVLSSLTNLFALFGARDNVDVEASKTTLINYFSRHFGIRNTEMFADMYNDLRGLYSSDSDLDKDLVIESICSGLKGQIEAEEQEMILLRLMQFCVNDELGFLADDELFVRTAQAFGVDKETFLIYCDFVGDKETEQVHKLTFNGFDGHITTMWCDKHNRLMFTYYGNDPVLMNDIPVLPNTFQTWTQSGVLKNKVSGIRLYFSTAFASYAKVDDGKSVEFCGRNINFRFPNSDNGVHDFSFTLQSGELVAVMGGSGAGKSTLMSILNGSMAPQVGRVTINGRDIFEPGAKELIGFVPQDDLLVEELTVYQNLWYTAKLCFEGMDDVELDKRVVAVLKQLGLFAAKDLKVGSAINKYISGGQRKRLNIALELIREPAVLFLDEPTSGLSSTDTEKVINILKELTYKGKLVVLNIHQPSSDVYKLFDRLWLLDVGGYPIFDGNPIEAITYFKSAASYADSDASTCPVCGNVNPEIVLNIIDEKVLDDAGEQTEDRKVSPQEWHDMYLKQRGGSESDAPKEYSVPETEQKTPNAFRQLLIQLKRNYQTKITNVQYLVITLLVAPALASICAFLTHYSPAEGYTVMDNKNLVSYLFMAVIVSIFMGMSGSAEEIIKDRALLKREKFLHLSYPSYILSKIIFMASVTLLQTLLFVVVGNLIMGIHDIFFVWWGILFLVAFLSGLVGLLLSQTLNSAVAIYITIPILLIPQILLCGLVVNFSDLTPKSTTGNVPFVGNLIPSRWAYEALAVTQFSENEFEKDLFETQKIKYEAQYYYASYLYEVQSQLESMEDERKKGKEVNPVHLDVIKKALHTISKVCDMSAFSGEYNYANLRKYTDDAEEELSSMCNKASLREDNIISGKLRAMGKDEYVQLKKDHYNIQLENLCVSADSKHTHDIVDGHIVPRVGFVYLTPQGRWGGAPFYSSVKIVGTKVVSTLIFNVCVLLFMALVLSILLFCDFPGRYLRNDK